MSGFRIAVLASGAGTNLQAILDKLHGRDGFEVIAVASDKPGARALGRAEELGITTAAFPHQEHRNREERDRAMGDWLEERRPDLIVLAGYMQLLSATFVQRFGQRMINVHPALLPSFPGLDAIGQAIDHGVKITGVTVHFVDEGVDSGPIITQRPVEIRPGESREELEERIHAVEHELLPETIGLIAAGAVGAPQPGDRVVEVRR